MSTMFARRFIGMLLLVLLSITILASRSAAAPISQQQLSFPTRWSSYIDHDMGISLRYPSSWVIVPPSASDGVGETLTLRSQPIDHNHWVRSRSAPFKIEIGIYLVEWTGDKSIKEWTDEYNAAGGLLVEPDLMVTESKMIRVNRHLALRETGYSSITFFRYINVVRGNTIWFIWSNAETEDEIAVFDRVVRSFRYRRNAPTNLSHMYGSDFMPFHLPISVSLETDGSPSQLNDLAQLSLTSVEPRISSSWRSPFNGGPYNVRCDSTAHQGHSNFAIDIPRSEGTLIVGAQTGVVSFIGWNNNGYGNLVKAITGNQEAYYGHLHSFDWTTIQMFNPWQVTKSSGVGWVGSTGSSTGPHLHFHVRLTDNITPVDLTGMQTFSPTAGLYPETGNPCGSIRYP